MTRSRSENHPIVLESIRKIRTTTNPYIVTLIERLSERTATHLFSWRVALFGRYDVLHIHWPERLFERNTRAKTFAHSILTLALTVRVRVTGTAVVRTLHNLTPHETRSRLSDHVTRELDRVTTSWIALNGSEADLVTPGRVSVTIPHPHYRGWFDGIEPTPPVEGQLGFFGQIRPYKNVEGLLRAFAEITDTSLTLHVRGAVADSGLESSLALVAEKDNRVDLMFGHLDDAELAAHIFDSEFLMFGHLDDAELAAHIFDSELVILPYLEMHNSGALLLALSLGRPVLVPENTVTRRLADEVGHHWVRRYEGELEAADILSARSGHPDDGVDGPDLSAREWDRVVDLHLSTFGAAIMQARRR